MDAPDYRSLPPQVPLAETISTVDTSTPADPDALRSRDQHEALRDD